MTYGTARVSLTGGGYQATWIGTNLPAGAPLALTATYPGDTNYSYGTGTLNLTVNKLQLTVTADDQVMTYGSAVPPLTATITGLVNGDSLLSAVTGAAALSTSATSASGVDTYGITCDVGTLASANYSFTCFDGALAINPAPLTATANNQTMVHGTSLPALTGSLAGIMNGDPLTFQASTTATSSSPPGWYAITAGVSGDTSNYVVTLVNAALSIT